MTDCSDFGGFSTKSEVITSCKAWSLINSQLSCASLADLCGWLHGIDCGRARFLSREVDVGYQWLQKLRQFFYCSSASWTQLASASRKERSHWLHNNNQAILWGCWNFACVKIKNASVIQNRCCDTSQLLSSTFNARKPISSVVETTLENTCWMKITCRQCHRGRWTRAHAKGNWRRTSSHWQDLP